MVPPGRNYCAAVVWRWLRTGFLAALVGFVLVEAGPGWAQDVDSGASTDDHRTRCLWS